MKIKEIIIGNLVYKIKYVDEIVLVYEEDNDIDEVDDGTQAYGLISYENQVITLDKTLSDERLRVTFLHEVLHGLDEHYPYLNFDEIKTDTVASILIDFIDNNPLFILYLLFSSTKLKDKIKKMLSFFLPKL